MPRVAAVSTKDAGWFVRAVYRYSRRRFGTVLEPLAVQAHHPGLLLAGGLHETLVERTAKTLPVAVRELVQYRVAQQLGCSWCVDFGAMLQRLDGLDIERLRDIDGYATSPAYSERERLALGYADAVTASPVTVSDEQVATLRAEFGDRGLIELTYLITLENMRARFNSALHITDQGFASGDACAVPDATVLDLRASDGQPRRS